MKVKYESVFPFFVFTKQAHTIFVTESRTKLDPKKIEITLPRHFHGDLALQSAGRF